MRIGTGFVVVMDTIFQRLSEFKKRQEWCCDRQLLSRETIDRQGMGRVNNCTLFGFRNKEWPVTQSRSLPPLALFVNQARLRRLC